MLTCFYKGEWVRARESSRPLKNSEVKRLAAAASKPALVGYSLLRLKAGSFLIGLGTSFKELTELSAVERFFEGVLP